MSDKGDMIGRVTTLLLRRVGKTRSGFRYPPTRRWPRDLRPAVCDPLSATVHADWLEENGEAQAAAKLRKAFPLPPAGGPEGEHG